VTLDEEPRVVPVGEASLALESRFDRM
jgi:hypothetical protein